MILQLVSQPRHHQIAINLVIYSCGPRNVIDGPICYCILHTFIPIFLPIFSAFTCIFQCGSNSLCTGLMVPNTTFTCSCLPGYRDSNAAFPSCSKECSSNSDCGRYSLCNFTPIGVCKCYVDYISATNDGTNCTLAFPPTSGHGPTTITTVSVPTSTAGE